MVSAARMAAPRHTRRGKYAHITKMNWRCTQRESERRKRARNVCGRAVKENIAAMVEDVRSGEAVSEVRARIDEAATLVWTKLDDIVQKDAGKQLRAAVELARDEVRAGVEKVLEQSQAGGGQREEAVRAVRDALVKLASELDIDARTEAVSNQLQSVMDASKMWNDTDIDDVVNAVTTLSDKLGTAIRGAESGDVSSLALLVASFAAIVLVSSINSGTRSTRGNRMQGTSTSSRSTSVVSAADALPFEYDPQKIENYFRRRPIAVLRRLTTVLVEAAPVLLQKRRDPEDLVQRLTRLGPTFIKAGQAASIRADILPAEYAIALRELQDRLPAFSTREARAMICEDLGIASTSEVFDSIASEPIAAASLGQVYRARLRNALSGEDVAVKVQRPRVRETICLDLLILRWLAPIVKERQGLNSDLVAIVDEWGYRFLAELDYEREAQSAMNFNKCMADRGLSEGVFAPEVIVDATRTRVLTTRWIDGQRLDELDNDIASTAGTATGSSGGSGTVGDGEDISGSPTTSTFTTTTTTTTKEEVLRLCQLALNTYLVMLCETGNLHADPHPGNLLRENSTGRLCILDWGLTTEVRKERQVALIEYIAHLTNDEWTKVPRDLVELGFVPPAMQQTVLREPDITQVLGLSLKAITAGGGAGKVRSSLLSISSELRNTQQKYGNLFQIPPYFAYILRTFNILEGICLGVDSDYSITSNCYPYLARRLLTDDDPRIRSALDSLLFVYHNGSRQINVERIRKLTSSYASFETAKVAPSAERDGSTYAASQAVVTDLVFARDGYLQSVLVSEMARAIDVGLKSRLKSVPIATMDVPGAQALARVFDGATQVARRFLPIDTVVEGLENALDATSTVGDTTEAAATGLGGGSMAGGGGGGQRVLALATLFPYTAVESIRSGLVDDLDTDDLESLKTYQELLEIVAQSNSGEDADTQGAVSASMARDFVQWLTSTSSNGERLADTGLSVFSALTYRVLERAKRNRTMSESSSGSSSGGSSSDTSSM